MLVVAAHDAPASPLETALISLTTATEQHGSTSAASSAQRDLEAVHEIRVVRLMPPSVEFRKQEQEAASELLEAIKMHEDTLQRLRVRWVTLVCAATSAERAHSGAGDRSELCTHRTFSAASDYQEDTWRRCVPRKALVPVAWV